MRFVSFSVLSALAIAAAAAPSLNHVVHERRSHMPSGWEWSSLADKSMKLPMRIGLKQANLDIAHDKLMEISDPDSPKYGQHWSHEQIIDFFSPSEDAVAAVKEWLTSAGVIASDIKHSFNKGWLEFDVTAAEAEALLKTEYHNYKHASGKPHVACEEYSVPAHIQEHIDIITPTLHFDSYVHQTNEAKGKRGMKRDTLSKRAPKNGLLWGGPKKGKTPVTLGEVDETVTCGELIVPSCLRTLYNIPKGTKNLTSFGIVEYSPETYLQEDLDAFELNGLTNTGGEPVGTGPDIEGIDGGYFYTKEENFDYQGEPDLDLEYAIDLVYPQTVTLLQVGDNGTYAYEISFNNFLDGIDKKYCKYEGGDTPGYDESFPDPHGYKGKEQCGVWSPPMTISTSYGYNEHDLTPAYEIRQCNEKLGMAGVSFFYSSGDYGVAGNGGECIAANGSYNDGTSGMFNPSFPAGCPYITSVGATQIPLGGSATQPETACETVIYSGGGFSNVFAEPAYQKSALKTYYKKYKPSYNSSQYNNSETSRGHPDVSANGANYAVFIDDEPELVYGTSASSPVFASIITLINNERAAINKSSLGFLNPTFYKNPGMFNDIVNGTNEGCGTDGFTAVPGWDPVTGLGTPNYTKMLAVLKDL